MELGEGLYEGEQKRDVNCSYTSAVAALDGDWYVDADMDDGQGGTRQELLSSRYRLCASVSDTGTDKASDTASDTGTGGYGSAKPANTKKRKEKRKNW